MITYYIGNVRGKRNLFNDRGKNVAVADNADVLADFPFRGKVCFVLGAIPFGDMRVGEYLAYSRALRSPSPLSAREAKQMLKRVGVKVSLGRKMRTLSRLTYRFVALAAAVGEDTDEVRVNLDGIAYSRLARLRMRRILGRTARGYGSVKAAVSDCRYLSRRDSVVSVTGRGDLSQGMSKSRSRKYSRLYFSADKRKKSLALSVLHGRKTLLCDN